MSATASSGSPSRPDEVGRQPQLVNTTPAGDEQLTHCLAPFDLLAAETLAAALRRVRRAGVATTHRTVRPAPRLRGAGDRDTDVRGVGGRRRG